MDCIYFKNWIFSEGLDEGETEKKSQFTEIVSKRLPGAVEIIDERIWSLREPEQMIVIY